MPRWAMVDAYVEICIALLLLASLAVVGLSIVLSHLLLGG